MSVTAETKPPRRPREPRPLTIGAVVRRLRAEFPDVSISKIRYLEDQGLLTPKRTRGGYRLFSDDDVEVWTPGSVGDRTAGDKSLRRAVREAQSAANAATAEQ